MGNNIHIFTIFGFFVTYLWSFKKCDPKVSTNLKIDFKIKDKYQAKSIKMSYFVYKGHQVLFYLIKVSIVFKKNTFLRKLLFVRKDNHMISLGHIPKTFILVVCAFDHEKELAIIHQLSTDRDQINIF